MCPESYVQATSTNDSWRILEVTQPNPPSLVRFGNKAQIGARLRVCAEHFAACFLSRIP